MRKLFAGAGALMAITLLIVMFYPSIVKANSGGSPMPHSLTGYILAFPTTFTKVLPGQFVAASVTFHGYEATLAVLTIIIWHFYDVIFKPGIFPTDTSIFTGKISKERIMEEHPLEYVDILEKQAKEELSEPSPGEISVEINPVSSDDISIDENKIVRG